MAGIGEAITHGGGLIAAGARFPSASGPWIDLSTGINAVPYPLHALPDSAWHRLPEPEEVQALETVAAGAYGVPDPAMVVAAPGTQILISLLPRLLPQPHVSIVGPTYAEHAATWTAAGAVVSMVDDITASGAGCTVLCNPNNPDGRRWPALALTALAARCALLVVDEAFADLEGPGSSLAPAMPSNTVVLRSFGKSYGLAGLRLGFAVASPDIAAMIRTALGPWAISGAAVAIGRAALADRAWRTSASSGLVSRGAQLDALLAAAGFRPVGGTRLFRLVACDDAASVHDKLGRAGILVRHFADQPEWLRFGIPAGEWGRIGAALLP